MKKIFLLFLAIFLFSAPQYVLSQCGAGFCTSSAVQFGATQSTTSNTFVTAVSCTGANQYNLFNVTSGQTYEWSMCSGDGALTGGLFDTDMSLYNHSNGSLICYNDDEVTFSCGLNSKIVWTANFTGTVRVQVTEYSCQQLTGACLLMAWRCSSCTGSYNPCTTIPTISNCGVSSTFTQTGTSGILSPTTCGYATPGREVIYQFTAPVTGTYNFLVSSYTSSGGWTDAFWKPASGGCNNSGWNCITDFNSTGNYPAAIAMSFTAGVTYYIMLDPEHTGNTSITFNLTCPAAPNPCTTVPTISTCGVATTANFPSFTGAWNITDCGFNTPGLERMYQFTAPLTGEYGIQVTSATGGYVDYFWKSGALACDNTNWNCIADINTTGSYLGNTPMNFTAGVSYRILLDPESTTAGAHTFNIICPTPADPSTPSLSANPICAGGSVTLTANGVVGTPYWYTGSCGGTQVGTGTTLTVSPTTSTVYYVRNYNGFNFSTNCASISITVESPIGNNVVGANQTLCANAIPSTFTGTLPTGGDGSYNYQWQSSTSLPTWVTMPGEINPDHSSLPLAQNTYFRRVTNAGVCTPSTSNALTVTSIANVTPAVSISTPSNTLCSGNTITFTATPTNPGNTPTYQWYLNFGPVGSNQSTYTFNGFSNGDQITLDMTSSAVCANPTQVGSNTVTLQVYNIPLIPNISSNSPICQGSTLSFSSNVVPGALYNWTGPGGYTSSNVNDAITTAQPSNSGVYSLTHTENGCTSPAATSTLTVQATLSPISITNSQTLCLGSTAAALTASTPTGGTGLYLFQWESSPDNSTWQLVSAGPSSIINPGILSSSTYYRTILSAGICSPVTSNSIGIVIENPITQNTLLADQTICSGLSASPITGSVPTGGSGSYQYSWQSSPTNAVWVNLVGSTLPDYNPGSLTALSYFRRVVVSGVCPATTSTSVVVLVNPIIINNTIGSAQTICPGVSPTAFTGSLPAGGLGTYGYQWESSSDNSSWVAIPAGTALTFTEGTVVLSAYYRRVVTSGVCTLNSTSILLTVIPQVTNNILSSAQTLCVGGTFATITGGLPGGGSGVYDYSWQSSSDNSSWSLMSGVTTQNYSHGVANTTVFYRRLVASGSCPGVPSASIGLITEQLLGNNLVSSSQTICLPLPAAPLVGTLPTGGNLQYLYQWETSTDNSSWSVFSGETNQSLSLSGPSSNTYYRRALQGGLCPALTSTSVSIQTTPSIGNNQIGTSQTICIGGIPSPITGVLPTGGTGFYSYTWETSSNNSTWAIVVGENNQSYNVGNVFINTYYRRVINSGVCNSISTAVSVQGDQTSGNNFISSSQTICTGSTPLPYAGTLPTGGTGFFTYQWQSSANSSMWLNIAGATNQNYTPPALTFTQYFRRQVTSGGCAPINSDTISVLVVPIPTATITGTTMLCPGGSAQLTVTLGGHAPWSFTWTNGTTPTSLIGYSSNTYLINTTPSSSTTFSVTSVSSICAGTVSAPAIVTVTAVPTATLSGTQTICNGQITNLSVNFTGLAPWNLTWTDGTNNSSVNGITANPYLISVSPGAPRSYTLTSVSNACPGLVSGTAVVTTYAPPGAFISTNQTICQGVGSTLSISFTGVAPWDVIYTDGTNNYPVNGITSSLYTFPINPAFNTTYSAVSVTNGCVGVAAGVADIAVRPAPSASISGTQNICTGDSAQLTVTFTGVAPWILNYTDGTTSTIVSGILNSPYLFSVTPSTSRNYTLNSVYSSCFGSISGTAAVTVSSPSVGFLSGNATICQGSSTTIQVGLSGTGPWAITYSEGTTAVTIPNIVASPYSFTVTPSQTRVYSLINVSSACTGTAAGSATVVVNPIPTASMSGTTAFCSGGTAQLSIQLTGVSPYSVTYNNGGPPIVVSGITSSPYVFTVTPVAASTYTVTNVSATCAGTVSGNTAVVPEGPPDAVLSGTQTTCISVGAVLTVNFTGTGPFSLVYTDGASNFTQNNITANPYSWTVNPGSTQKTYQLVSLTGACSGTVSGSAIVDVQARPVAVLSTPTGLCTGNTTQFSLQLSGTGPWDVSYTDGTNTFSENGIVSSPYSWTVNPSATATWNLVSVSDLFCTGTVLSTPMVVHVSPSPSVTFSGNTTICGGGSATLSISPVGAPPFSFIYSDGTSNYTITGINGDTSWVVTPADTTIYRVVDISSLGCGVGSSDSVIVTVIPAPSSAWVGADQTICSLNASLVGNNPTSGTGVWSVVLGTGVIANPNAFSTSISGMSVGLNVVQWTISNGSCVSAAQMNLYVSTPPTNANAGPNQNICGTNTLMAANTPVNGIGTWTIVSGTGTIADVNDPNTAVTGISAGQLVLMWTIASGNCISNATVTINASPSAPVANAGNDQQICTGTSLLTALPSTSSGQWSLVSGNPVTFSNSNSAQTIVSGLILGSYQFVWTTASSGCSNTDTMVVQVIPAPVANFSFIQFGFNADFTDLSQGGINAWDWAFGDGGISTQQNPQHTYFQAGSYNVRLIVTNACRKDTIFSNLRIYGVGTENELASDLNVTVYPNPADEGYFYIRLSGLEGQEDKVKISMRSVTGAVVFENEFDAAGLADAEFKIQPEKAISKGVYSVEIGYGDHRKVIQQIIR
jgi:hypothetical protein